MVFDELLPREVVEEEIDYLEPNRKNIAPLLDFNYRHTLISASIFAFLFLVAYIFLIVIMDLSNDIHLYWYFSAFIGVAAFIDQILLPDENSKFGYLLLLALYYLVYKFAIFGSLVYLYFLSQNIEYEIDDDVKVIIG